jgi:ABC-type nitrate/sulfonate/bicarbonate transport system ATPase subunit
MQEDVQLGDRLLMLNNHGHVCEDINIDLPRPRNFADSDFVLFYANVVHCFHQMQVKENLN